MNVQTIGSVAAELLEQSKTAVVQGKTRQGVFLRLDSGWVVFLSHEGARGPLTLNIEDEPGQLNYLAIGAHIQVAAAYAASNRAVIASEAACPERSDGKQSPPKSEIASSSAALQRPPRNDMPQLDTLHAQVWSAPSRPSDYLLAAEREIAVVSTIRQAQSIRPAASLTALQAVLAGDNHVPEDEAGYFYPHLVRIKELLAGRQRSMMEAFTSPLQQLDPQSLSALLGLGRGLTPTGDDILLGLLLALNRWRAVLAPGLDISSLNRNILAQAYQRTTTISANLIECATRGQADERLITALDSMIIGTPGPAEAASLLADWGSSSGLDALCGMALVI